MRHLRRHPEPLGLLCFRSHRRVRDSGRTDQAAPGSGAVVAYPEKTFLAKEAGYFGLFLDSEGNKIGVQSMP